ncbi:roadblock/LC7 domain-containing protein [Persephonella sp.]|jgi:predicted regulator of Ras-like GTPase activity (Roadblock/LC7/MglB family)
MASRFEDILQAVVRDAGAEGAVLVSPDGLAIASVLPEGIDEDRVAAMGAAILSLGERVTTELNKGTLEQLYVKGSKGYMIFTGIGDLAVLGILAPSNAKLGLLLMEIRRAAKQIEESLG